MRAEYVATATRINHNYRQITRRLIPVSSILHNISHLQMADLAIVEPIRQKSHSVYIFYN